MARCWMCEDTRFRSVCPTHPTGVRALVDPRPRLATFGRQQN